MIEFSKLFKIKFTSTYYKNTIIMNLFITGYDMHLIKD